MIHLKKGEKTLSIKRRHFLVLLLHIFPLALVFLAIIVFMLVLSFISLDTLPDWLTGIDPSLSIFNIRFLVLFLSSLFLLMLWQVLFVQITHYYLDCWIVTDERTIHTELIGLFNRFLSSVYHHQIQDVSVDVRGILPTFFRYGNVQIQTAGKFREFIFHQIPEPYKVKEIIIQAQIDFFRKIKEKEILPDQIEQTTENIVRDD